MLNSQYKISLWLRSIAGVFLLVMVLWRVPQLSLPEGVTNPKERADLLNANRENILKVIQTFGGLGFIATGYLAWRNLKVTEDKQVADRFAEAVKMLTNERLETRVGGIYALERVSKYSQDYHSMVMEVLTSFIRDSSDRARNAQKIDQGIQSALNVIGNRSIDQDQQRLDLQGAYLAGSILENANLEGALLEGVVLENSLLSGVNLKQADLWGANLTEAKLEEANLEGAFLAYAILARANLWDTNLREANLWNANLEDADLWKADLTGASLISAILEKTILKEANLTNVEELTEKQLASALLCKTTLPTNVSLKANRDCKSLEELANRDCKSLEDLEIKKGNDDPRERSKLVKNFIREREEARKVSIWINDRREILAKKFGSKALEEFPSTRASATQEEISEFRFSIYQFLEQISHSLKWNRYGTLDDPEIPLIFDHSIYEKTFLLIKEEIIENQSSHFSRESRKVASKVIDYLIRRLPDI
jgi:uncharacterized protein YjbI with pentapeptide repeats